MEGTCYGKNIRGERSDFRVRNRVPEQSMFMKKYKKIPQVGSVMTPFPYSVDTDDTIAEVERLMDEHQIRHIPVQQDGRVVGIISERDIYRLSNDFCRTQKRLRSELATL